jgi:hypothetical protein
MKVRFLKAVAVDYEDARLNEIADKTFQRHQVVDVALEENVNGYWNLHFDNGDLAIGVPKSAVEVLKA